MYVAVGAAVLCNASGRVNGRLLNARDLISGAATGAGAGVVSARVITYDERA